MDDHETPVIFRKFGASENYAVIALFPAEPCDLHGPDFTSYMHVGQHGGASSDIVSRTKLATPAEYADLKRELEAEPYGYRFKVCSRISRHHRETHRVEQLRLRRLHTMPY